MTTEIHIRLFHESCPQRSPHPNPAPVFCEGLKLGLNAQILFCGMCREEIVIVTGDTGKVMP